MKKTPTIELNDYHKARNERMVKKVSQQPLMSAEEFIEQTQRLARQSTTTTSKQEQLKKV